MEGMATHRKGRRVHVHGRAKEGVIGSEGLQRRRDEWRGGEGRRREEARREGEGGHGGKAGEQLFCYGRQQGDRYALANEHCAMRFRPSGGISHYLAVDAPLQGRADRAKAAQKVE